jgi:hypothetical protein
MQTLHRLWRFRNLRAISPGQSPSRWRTPSMRESTSTWEALSALPNPPGPTLAVGSPAVPQPGARAVAPRWRWSRLPGAGAERTPQHARASVGPAPRQSCVGRSAISQSWQTGCACRLRGITRPASIAKRIARAVVGSDPLAGEEHGTSDIPGRSVLRGGQGRPAAAIPSLYHRGMRHVGISPPLFQGCAAAVPCLPSAVLPLLMAPRSFDPALASGLCLASSAHAGCSPDPVQVPCRSLDPGSRMRGRAFAVMLFPGEAAWPATTSR